MTWRQAGYRVVAAIPLLFIVLSASFFLQQLIPGNIASYVLGSTATSEQRRQFDASLGLDRPLGARYLSAIGNALHGNLGNSWVSGQSVAHQVLAAVPVTVTLALLAMAVIVLLGVALGTWAAVRRGRPADRVIQSVTGIGSAVPNFWVAVVLVLLLAIKIRVFPATGYVPFADSPGLWLSSLVLPVAALAIAPLAAVVLQVRSAMSDVLATPYVRSLRALGLPRHRILLKHALRNAAAPVVTTLGFQLLGLLAGAVVIEQLFNLPGVGTLLLTGVLAHDVPVVQGTVMFFAVAVVVVNLLVDLAVAALNPRVRRS